MESNLLKNQKPRNRSLTRNPNLRSGVYFSLERARKGTPDFLRGRLPLTCHKSDVILCHTINMSQSGFTGNYLHSAIQGKTTKQNIELRFMIMQER